LSVHSINTRNKHHLHRPIANLSCFQKGASYSRIRFFNNLPQSITSLRNEKPQFKVALKLFLCAYSFYSVDEFFACTDDMYYWLTWMCQFLHSNNFICLVCFCMFLTCSTSYCLVTASGIYGMHICMHVYMYVCMYVCVCVCMYMYACMYVCVCIYVCACVCMCVCIYIYCIYIYLKKGQWTPPLPFTFQVICVKMYCTSFLATNKVNYISWVHSHLLWLVYSYWKKINWAIY